MTPTIRKGMTIIFKPEFRDEGDKFSYVAVSEVEKGRFDVVAVGSGLPLPPINTVKVEMVEVEQTIARTDLFYLSEIAKPTSHDDWGSERQIEAENTFFNAVREVLAPSEYSELEDYCLKANTEEMIAEALRMVDVPRAELAVLSKSAIIDADIDALTVEYVAWNKAQGLELCSADEHVNDEDLTEERRAWVRDFVQRWEDASPYYGKDGLSSNRLDELAHEIAEEAKEA